MVTIHVRVPLSEVATLRRCASLLRLGGKEAETLFSLTDPLKALKLDDALKIAKLVLK